MIAGVFSGRRRATSITLRSRGAGANAARSPRAQRLDAVRKARRRLGGMSARPVTLPEAVWHVQVFATVPGCFNGQTWVPA
ncbi:hypothetical protein [Rhodopila globiformis]|uniref:Uncharacterized protein n=1 Tax=Rhodopila globiformis TaxID=1071 RepID=A0A2S6NB35_RHOGL|nr:hypothetical protein [Rhodopila globiformis]PPQ31828.1 hypothetical protein CCS01_16555 [Rhodopila globiformis]